MISRWISLAVVGGLGLLPIGSPARSYEEATAAFVEGRFLEAADIAEDLKTSAGYALAAQSLAIHGHYLAAEEDRMKVMERAMNIGLTAVEADPTNPEAHYQAAHSAGRYAQNLGQLTALQKGMAQKIRRRLEAALELQPDFGKAHLAMGGWHADIAGAGALARMIYGANRKKAIEHFERAMELTPDSIDTLYQYAIRLPGLDRGNGRERAEELLAKAAQLPERNAYDGFLREEVLEAMEAFKEDY